MKPDQPRIDQKKPAKDDPFQTILDNQAKILKQLAVLNVAQGDRKAPMDIEEAAIYLRSTPKSVGKLTPKGLIPCHKKLGLKFYRDELDEWVRESEYGRTLRKVS